MKCLSCGKIFDYDKYYGICPKCGTYNKPNVQADAGAQTENYHGQHAEQVDSPYVNAETYDYVKPTKPVPSRDEKAAKTRKTLILLISILIILSIVFAVVKNVVVGFFGSSESWSNVHVDVEEATVVDAELGEEVLVEDEYGRSLKVSGVELLAEADTVGGLPTGQRLIAVRVESNEVADLDYDTYSSSPVGDFFLYYDGTYRSCVPPYKFDDGGFDDVIGNRQEIQTYDFTSQKNHSGYVFFFVPADAKELAFVYSVQNVKNGDLVEYVRVPLLLESAGEGDALGTQSMDENITTLPSTDDETMKPVVD